MNSRWTLWPSLFADARFHHHHNDGRTSACCQHHSSSLFSSIWFPRRGICRSWHSAAAGVEALRAGCVFRLLWSEHYPPHTHSSSGEISVWLRKAIALTMAICRNGKAPPSCHGGLSKRANGTLPHQPQAAPVFLPSYLQQVSRWLHLPLALSLPVIGLGSEGSSPCQRSAGPWSCQGSAELHLFFKFPAVLEMLPKSSV